MKLVFVSNILNHHQIALCEALRKRCDIFYFIATEDVGNIGFQKSVDADYVIKYYFDAERQKAENEIMTADAVIFGACPNELIKSRLKDNKLSFLFSERFLKKGVWRRFIPRTRNAIIDRIAQYNDKNIYLLCASAYLAYDLSFFNFPEEKYLKWGYFPEIKEYDNLEQLIMGKQQHSILWAGRLLDWKHPEKAILLAKFLKQAGYEFQLDVVGDGPLKKKLERLIRKEKLERHVYMRGAVSSAEVRSYMEKAEIFLFTSNRYEGWGAVLNEAMNSGCAVIASHAIGSVPFLIKDKNNGLIYKNGDCKDLYNKALLLLNNDEYRFSLSSRAYKTITEHWNAEMAAQRLCCLITNLLDGREEINQEGVCSKAEVLKENWYR